MVSLLSAVRRFSRLLCVCVSTLTLLSAADLHAQIKQMKLLSFSQQPHHQHIFINNISSKGQWQQQQQKQVHLSLPCYRTFENCDSKFFRKHVTEKTSSAILQETCDSKTSSANSSGTMWQQNFFSKFLRKHVTANSSGNNWQQILQQIFEETFG